MYCDKTRFCAVKHLQLTFVALLCCAVLCCCQVYDRSALDAEREGITVCYNMLQQGVATAADMDDVDVKFRHVVEMAVSGALRSLFYGAGSE